MKITVQEAFKRFPDDDWRFLVALQAQYARHSSEHLKAAPAEVSGGVRVQVQPSEFDSFGDICSADSGVLDIRSMTDKS